MNLIKRINKIGKVIFGAIGAVVFGVIANAI